MVAGMEWGQQRGPHVARAEDRHTCHVYVSKGHRVTGSWGVRELRFQVSNGRWCGRCHPRLEQLKYPRTDPMTPSPYHPNTPNYGLTQGPVWGTIPAGNRTSFLYRDRLPFRDWQTPGLALPVLSEDETHDRSGTRGGRSHRSDRAPV